MTQRAIVLAAGRGTRLNSGENLPKPLKPIAGVPMLVRILGNLQREGIREAVIVVGYRGEQIRAALTAEPSLWLQLHFVENTEYDKSNGVSVLAAEDYLDQDCLLTMADHLYSPEVVRRLVAFQLPPDSCVLGVDDDIERCFDLDDATKVKLSGSPRGRGKIERIDKQLEVYDALDTGVFRIGPALVNELRRIYSAKGDCSLSDGIGALARDGHMYACGVGDARWIDVDTPEAAQRAEAMLRVFGEGLGDEPNGGARPDPEAIELFAPTWVRAATPYNENHFALAARKGDVARLMSNESPYRPSGRVLEAIMQAAMDSNFYPNGAEELRQKLGAREGVDGDHVLLGAGSAELIDLAIRTFVAPGEEVLLNVPTFSMYEARTRTVGGIPVMVPLPADGDLDVAAVIAAITERTKLIFLCSPNNPTGNQLDERKVRRILRLGLPTVIDEAYSELSHDGASLHHLVAEFPNALVFRTFSKAFGLAGMRVGYALGHPAHIRLLSRVKLPWNLSCLAIAAASATLDDMAEQERRIAALQAGREVLERELSKLPGVRVIPSEANFVLLDVADTGLEAATILEKMLSRGFFIRSLGAHRAGGSLLRITVGDPTQNRGCLRAFRQVVCPELPAQQPTPTPMRAVDSTSGLSFR